MFTLVNGELEEQLTDPQARKQWLVLDRHPDFIDHWIIEGFSNDYLYDLGTLVGSYRAVPTSGLERFIEVAGSHGYHMAFFEDPKPELTALTLLDEEPTVKVESPFDNTVNGMLFYQVQGFNALRGRDYGVARWDTGTGKTVLASALVKHHQQLKTFDTCFFVVKKNNKVNTARKLRKLVGVDAMVISGAKRVRGRDGLWLPGKREKLFGELAMRLEAGERGNVVILNYETFKNDFVHRVKDPKNPKEKGKMELTEWGERFFPGHDLMFIWDEMPVKLKSRTSELYRSICKLLYRTDPPQVNRRRLRPHSMRSYMLSALPVERNPEDWFNCIRLMDGGRTYGTVTDFHETYVRSWNDYDPTKPEDFHEFERMRLKAAHFIHQASKDDPRIAAVFPKAVSEVVYIDWDERNAVVYNEIQDIAESMLEDEGFDAVPILSLIGCLQMVCDAPEMVQDSAARRAVYEEALEQWESVKVGKAPQPDGSGFALKLSDKLKLSNERHPKFEKLHEILSERHAEDQVAIYTCFNETIMPYLEAALTKWGISYGRYAGTERQQQRVQDAFQAGKIRVFLSSDSGSDSIDLDAGNVVIDYNLPWNWTTLIQRHNRVHRPTSNHDTVYYYSLVMEGSVEERRLEIIERKRGYHNQLFDPAAVVEDTEGLTRDDYLYILTGRR